MDDFDRRILNLAQSHFPIAVEPFAAIAEMAAIPEDEVLIRIKRMQEEGIIRRIGAIFDPRQLGYVSTLCAARVPEEQDAVFIETVNAFPGVTHNYRRNDAYNIWFTLIAPTEDDLEEIIRRIREKTGVSDILSLRAARTFKINAQFDV